MTFLLSVAVPCMKATILCVLQRGCSERRFAYDFDPLTESFPRSQLGVAPSKQNDAVHRLAGFAQNWPQVKKSQNHQSGEIVFGVPHSPSIVQQRHSKSPKRGLTRLPHPETQLHPHDGSMPS